jgi:hypothetical protein
VQAQDVYLFAPRPAVAYVNDITNNPHIGGQKVFVGQNAPRGTAISYYLKSGANDVKLSIIDGQGRTLCTTDAPKAAGINRVQWTLAAPQLGGAGGGGGNVPPGMYTAKLTVNGQSFSKQVEVLDDRGFRVR